MFQKLGVTKGANIMQNSPLRGDFSWRRQILIRVCFDKLWSHICTTVVFEHPPPSSREHDIERGNDGWMITSRAENWYNRESRQIFGKVDHVGCGKSTPLPSPDHYLKCSD